MSSPPAPGDLTPGARIGRFRIIDQLGQGGMGVVFRAMEENLGREVALKVISPLLAHDPEFRERFTREARAQASLESSHVVAVYAHGEEDGYLYIASQLVTGGDLGQMIRAQGPPTMVEALEIIEQVASGLADAHDAGLVHRDIKPGNVLVRRRPGAIRAYLADFGIARKVNAEATRFSGSTVGTPSYMAPELHNGAIASPATDIYALGCLLWVALTGSPPYRGLSEYQLVAAHVQQPIPQLAGNSPMINAANRVVRTAMAKAPADRYQSAAEMGADLQAALRLPVTPGAAVADTGGTAVRPVMSKPTNTPAQTPTPSGPGAWQPHATPTPTPGYLGTTPAGRRTSGGRKGWLLGGAAAVAALGVGIGAALITAEGGGDDPPPSAAEEFLALEPKEIVRSAEKDMAVVENARITGQFKADGTEDVAVDVVATRRGDCEGTMTSSTSGGVAEIRRVDDTVYLRADKKFWESITGEKDGGDVTAVIGDRWVVENSMLDSTEAFCDLDEFLERDGREGAEADSMGVADVNKDEAAKIEQHEGTQSEILYVRVAEPHYLLRVEESADDYFEFSDFDQEIDINKPRDSEIFDLQEYLDKFKGAGKP